MPSCTLTLEVVFTVLSKKLLRSLKAFSMASGSGEGRGTGSGWMGQ